MGMTRIVPQPVDGHDTADSAAAYFDIRAESGWYRIQFSTSGTVMSVFRSADGSTWSAVGSIAMTPA